MGTKAEGAGRGLSGMEPILILEVSLLVFSVQAFPLEEVSHICLHQSDPGLCRDDRLLSSLSSHQEQCRIYHPHPLLYYPIRMTLYTYIQVDSNTSTCTCTCMYSQACTNFEIENERHTLSFSIEHKFTSRLGTRLGFF